MMGYFPRKETESDCWIVSYGTQSGLYRMVLNRRLRNLEFGLKKYVYIFKLYNIFIVSLFFHAFVHNLLQNDSRPSYFMQINMSVNALCM